MASNTYVALATQTLGSSVSSVTFTPIPQGYTDLMLVINGTTAGDGSFRYQFNGDTGTNYSSTLLYGNGTSAISARGSNETTAAGGRSGTTNSTSIVQFQNYSNTTTYKTILSRGNNPAAILTAHVSMWRSTAAITSMVITNESGNISAGTTFSIYGIAAASVGAKATGGTIYSDASYFYHVFAGNGTFTPSQAITADYLVVAGGGGAGGGTSGGGGGGGLRSTVTATGAGGTLETALTLSSGTNYTVTIGAGGAAGLTDGSNGSAGSNSVFSTITSTGGGGGNHGGTGGSGGGGAGYGTNTGGAAIAGQVYAGGSTINTFAPYYTCGGGGGAGAPGASVNTSYVGGAGGIGIYTAMSDATNIGQLSSDHYYLSGGGGGGTNGATAVGGIGGGGASINKTTGVSGTANTGGGGGGSGTDGTKSGGAGGSGVVIVRYAR